MDKKLTLGSAPAARPARAIDDGPTVSDKPKVITLDKNEQGADKTNDKKGSSGKDTIVMTNTLFSLNHAEGGDGDDVIVQGNNKKDTHHNINEANGGAGEDIISQAGDNSRNTAEEENDGSSDIHIQSGSHQDNTSKTGDGNDAIIEDTDWSIIHAEGGEDDDAYVIGGNNNEIHIQEEGDGDDVVSISGDGNDLDVQTGDGDDQIQLNVEENEEDSEVGEGRKNSGTIDAGDGDDNISVGTAGSDDAETDVDIEGGDGEDTVNLTGEGWELVSGKPGEKQVYKNGNRTVTVNGVEHVNFEDAEAPDLELPDGITKKQLLDARQGTQDIMDGKIPEDPGTDGTEGPDGDDDNSGDTDEVSSLIDDKAHTVKGDDDLTDIDLGDDAKFTGKKIEGEGTQVQGGVTSSTDYYEVEVDGKTYYAKYNRTKTDDSTGVGESDEASFSGEVLSEDEAREAGILDDADDDTGTGDDKVTVNYSDIDGDDDGVVTKEELEAARDKAGDDNPFQKAFFDDVITNEDKLRQVNDDGDDGLSEDDFNTIKDRVNNGETVDEILADLDDADPEDTDNSNQGAIDAIDFILKNTDGDGDDKPDYNSIRSRTSDQKLKDMISRIQDNNDALTEMDNDDGDLNRGELEAIKKLLEKGYTLDQLISYGKDKDTIDSNIQDVLTAGGNPAASSGDKSKNSAGLQFLLDQGESSGILKDDDNQLDGDDYDTLRSRTSDQEVIDVINFIEDNKDAFSGLDGDSGDLNKKEIQGILQLAKQGYDLNYLVEIGKANNGTDLLSLLKDTPAPGSAA